MHIQLSEIPEQGIELQVNDDAWFPDNEIRRTGDLRANVFIERRQDRLIASGSINLVYVLDCDRCLERCELPQAIEFSLALEQEENLESVKVKEHQCASNEMDAFFFEGFALDIGTILEQQVLLANPAKKLCRDDCSGLCAECGENLNLGTCTCSEKPAESPFDVLGRLIDR